MPRNSKFEPFDFDEHVHRYAVWTAARAQRAFTSTKNIEEAIATTKLRKFAFGESKLTKAKFEIFHRETCNQLSHHLKKVSKKTNYGRMAKIVAIYLKTSIILRDEGRSERSKIIHPPIDAILIRNLFNEGFLKKMPRPWTLLTEKKYWALANEIEESKAGLSWKTEKYWRASSTQ